MFRGPFVTFRRKPLAEHRAWADVRRRWWFKALVRPPGVSDSRMCGRSGRREIKEMGCRQVEFVAGCLCIVGDSRQVPEGGRHRVHIAVGRASADLMLRKCLRSVRANLAPAVSKTRLRGSRSLAILRRCPRPALISPDRLSQVAPASSGVISPTSCCDVATRRSWCSTTSSLGVRLISTS